MLGPPLCSPRFVAMVFLNAIIGFVPLNIFAFFVTFLLFLCIFMHLCVARYAIAFVACVGTMHGAWYWYACHA